VEEERGRERGERREWRLTDSEDLWAMGSWYSRWLGGRGAAMRRR